MKSKTTQPPQIHDNLSLELAAMDCIYNLVCKRYEGEYFCCMFHAIMLVPVFLEKLSVVELYAFVGLHFRLFFNMHFLLVLNCLFMISNDLF